MNHQRDAAARRRSLGLGVQLAPNGQSYNVEICPPNWREDLPRKIWIGHINGQPIRDLRFARYVADTVSHYCGKQRRHYGYKRFTFPPLESLNLVTREEFHTYVRGIPGDQRLEFINKVKEVLERPDFILQGQRFLRIAPPADEEVAPVLPPPADEVAPVLPPPADEVAPVPSPPAEEGAPTDEGAVGSSSLDECEAAFEEDVDGAAMFARFDSSAQGASVAAFGLIKGTGSDEWNLGSVEQRLGPERFNPNDCPSGKDKDWDKTIEELNKRSALADLNAVDGAAPVFETPRRDWLSM